MTDSEFEIELFQLGLSSIDFSIKLSNQFASYHLKKGINCYEVFHKDERGGIHFKREFETEQMGKKALIDLVRILRGIKPKYFKLDSANIFNIEKSRILNMLQDKVNTEIDLKFIDQISSLEFKDSDGIQDLSDFLINYGISFSGKKYEEIFFFVESIINDENK